MIKTIYKEITPDTTMIVTEDTSEEEPFSSIYDPDRGIKFPRYHRVDIRFKDKLDRLEF